MIEKQSWLSREGMRLVMLALPFVFLFLFWEDLPEQIPIGWSRHGQPDNLGNKWLLSMLAGMNVLLYGMFLGLTRLLPPSEKYTPVWPVLQLVAHQILTFTFFLAGLQALRYTLPLNLVLQYGFITLVLVLGGFLGTIPRNSFFGIRLYWTLRSEVIWRQTHQFAGKIWVGLSLLMLFYSAWHGQEWVFPLYAALLLFLPTLYSYLLYKKELKSPAPPKK